MCLWWRGMHVVASVSAILVPASVLLVGASEFFSRLVHTVMGRLKLCVEVTAAELPFTRFAHLSGFGEVQGRQWLLSVAVVVCLVSQFLGEVCERLLSGEVS